MVTVNLKVSGYELTLADKMQTLHIPTGSKKFVQLKFEFDSCWQGLTRYAVFEGDKTGMALLDADDTCYVPYDFLQYRGTMRVGVYGMEKGEHDDTSSIYATTNMLPTAIIDGAFSADTVEDMSSNIFESSLNEWNDILTKMDSIKDTIMSSENVVKGTGCFYGVCETDADTATKVVATNGKPLTLVNGGVEAGVLVTVQFQSVNATSDPMLSVDDSTPAPIRFISDKALGVLPENYWRAYETLSFVFDGKYWCALGKGLASTEYYGATRLSNEINSSSEELAATPKAVKTVYDMYCYGICSSSADTYQKVISTDLSGATGTGASPQHPNLELAIGTQLTVLFKETNTYSGTISLYVDDGVGYPVKLSNSNTNLAGYWEANQAVAFVFDGTAWIALSSSGSSGAGATFATSNTTANTFAKIATTTNGTFTLKDGAMANIYFTYGNALPSSDSTTPLTLSIDKSTAKPLRLANNTALPLNGYWAAGEVLSVVYTGTEWLVCNKSKASLTTYGATMLSNAIDSDSDELAATASAVKTAYDLAASKLALTGGTMSGALVLADAPAEDNEAATKKYVDDQVGAIALYYRCICESDTDSATKTVVIEDDRFALEDGTHLFVTFTKGNTATDVTLQVNDGDAYAVQVGSDTTIPATYWQAGQIVELMFNGTAWVVVGTGLASTDHYGVTKLSDAIDSDDSTVAATPKAVLSVKQYADGLLSDMDLEKNSTFSDLSASVGQISEQLSTLQYSFDNDGKKISSIEVGDGGLLITTADGSQTPLEIDFGKTLTDVVYDSESSRLTFYSNDEQLTTVDIPATGGGGGSGMSYRVTFKPTSKTTMTLPTTSSAILTGTYTETVDDELTNLAGTITVQYKNYTASSDAWVTIPALSTDIMPGESFSLDVTPYLSTQNTKVFRVKVTGGESGIERSMDFSVTQVEISLVVNNFSSTALYTGDATISYVCYGSGLKKTMHFVIDGNDTAVDVGTSHSSTRQQKLELVGKYGYGAHNLEVYFTLEDGIKSNVLRYILLYDDGTSTAPMLGVMCDQSSVTYGDTLVISYITYTPNQETTAALTIKPYAYDTDGLEEIYTQSTVVTNIPNRTMYTWQGQIYSSTDTAYVDFICDGVETKTVSVAVEELDTAYDLNQISTGLVYQFSAYGRSNNDSDKELNLCEYTAPNGVTTNIQTQLENFNWISNGYVDGEALTFSGEATATVRLPMFSTQYTDESGQRVNLESDVNTSIASAGRTFEIDFQLNNVTDITAQIIRCMDGNSGFVVTPQNCYLTYANGTKVQLDDTGFIENEHAIAAAYINEKARLRLSFVIEGNSTTSNKCINIYINGQYANSCAYPDSAQFGQSSFIELGDDSCIMDVYEMRVYNRGLSATEILQNYNASPLSIQSRLSRFEDNDVLTDDGDVSYEKAKLKYNCLLLKGTVSLAKTSSVRTGWILTKADGSGSYTTEFELLDKDSSGQYVSSNKMQGTSSTKFPKKNIKVYLAKMKDGVSTKVKYSLGGYSTDGDAQTALSIEESTLCWKADYMSSDHANTFNANFAEGLFGDVLEAQDPSRGGDSRVQNTVHGFRCLLFVQETEDGPITFYGDGCLNNDKGNTTTFGLKYSGDSGNQTRRQKWEFLDNSNLLCTFESDNLFGTYQEQDGTVRKNAYAALESSYPDQGDLDDAGLEPNYDSIQVLYTWVYQRANFLKEQSASWTPTAYQGVLYQTEQEYRKAIFINEFERHFNKRHALVYYLFMEWVALCDNRAKNMFLETMNVTSEQLLRADNGQEMSIQDAINADTGSVDASMVDWENSTFTVWIPVLYDLDSCFGVENSGYLRIPYYADWNYKLNDAYMFNGRNSVLWLMVEEAFQSEITALAQELSAKSENGLNYESLYDIHIANNAKLVCAAVVNKDMESKYRDTADSGSDYRYLQRGSRTEQKDAFMYRRSNMLYSKYQCDQFYSKNNSITFRAGVQVSAEDSEITLTSSQVMYPTVRYGDATSGRTYVAGKTAAGVPVTFSSPEGQGSSDSVYLCGGSTLTDIGDISKFHPYELQLSTATGLKILTIGSNESGYQNTVLGSVDTSKCALLEEINLRNCTNIGSLDLSNNGLIRRVYLSGSGITNVTLPNGGLVEELECSALGSLSVLNQTHLKSFSIDSYDSLTSVHIENTPGVAMLEIVGNHIAQFTAGIRLVGIDETISDMSVLSALVSSQAKGKYIDSSGTHYTNETEKYPYISGTVYCESVGRVLLEQLAEIYPDLTVISNIVVEQHTVEFINSYTVDDQEFNILLNTQYVLAGSYAEDPIKAGYIDTPVRPQTAAESYTFSGWSTVLGPINSSMQIRAVYDSTARQYTVKWYGYGTNNKPLLASKTVYYGEVAEYDGEIPTYTTGESNFIYALFTGWDKSTACVVEDLNVYSVWDEANLNGWWNNDTRIVEKELDELTPAQFYGLVKQGKISTLGYAATGSTFPITLGCDFDFSATNLQQTVLVGDGGIYGEKLEFSGDTYLATDIAPFTNEDNWTFALEYCCTSSGYLFDAYPLSGSRGLRLSGNGNYVRLNIGSQTPDVGYLNHREVMVLRYVAAEETVYLYSSNGPTLTYSLSILTNTYPNMADVFSSARPITFGARYNGYYTDYGQGTIYWCKLWHGDLGDTNCRAVAAWPHETYHLEKISRSDGSTGGRNIQYYNGMDINNLDSAIIQYTTADFIFQELLPLQLSMYASSTLNGQGYGAGQLHTFLNARLYQAIPLAWRQIIMPIVARSIPDGQSTISTTVEYLFSPALADLFETSTSSLAIYADEAPTGRISSTGSSSWLIRTPLGATTATTYWTRSGVNTSTGMYYGVTYRANKTTLNTTSTYNICVLVSF